MRCAGCATRRDLPWPLFRRSLWAVGVSSAAFTLFHGMLLQSLPVPEPQQLFRVEIESRRSSRAEHSALNLMTNDAGQRIASSKISALAPSSSAKPRKIQTLRRAPSCDISAASVHRREAFSQINGRPEATVVRKSAWESCRSSRSAGPGSTAR